MNEVTMNTKVGILCLYLFQILVGCSVSESPYEKYDLTSLTEKCRNENKYLVIIIGMEDLCHSCAQTIRYRVWKNKEKSRQIFQNMENDRSIGAEFVV